MKPVMTEVLRNTRRSRRIFFRAGKKAPTAAMTKEAVTTVAHILWAYWRMAHGFQEQAGEAGDLEGAVGEDLVGDGMLHPGVG